jgi:hypothetical protein
MATYRQKIYQAFVAQYPNIRVTEQRIADQRRAIIKRKLLSDITITRIQQEALNLLNDNQNNIIYTGQALYSKLCVVFVSFLKL